MEPANPINQTNPINPNSTIQTRRRFSSKTVAIISTIFALISSPFISIANTAVYTSIFLVESAGVFTGLGEFVIIGGLSAVIWIPMFISSAIKANRGSKIAKLILTIMLIYLAIAGGLTIYFFV